MVFFQQIEESKTKKKKKISRIDKDCSDGNGRSKNREKFSTQGSSSLVSIRRRKGKNNKYSLPTFPRCGKKHEGRCFAGRDGCYGCGEIFHIMKDFPKAKDNVREGKNFSANQVKNGPRKRSRSYSL